MKPLLTAAVLLSLFSANSAQAQQARLVATSYLAGAEILVDGRSVGTVPVKASVTPGTHTITLVWHGTKIRSETLTFEAGGAMEFGGKASIERKRRELLGLQEQECKAAAEKQNPAAEPVGLEPSESPALAAGRYLKNGDQRGAAKALEGRTSNARELALLIDIYRALGDTQSACRGMKQFTALYPEARQAGQYQRFLTLGKCESR